MKTYSLFELNQYIRQVVALNFAEGIWVNAEIAQMSISKGHFYISLIEKEEDGEKIMAQSQAILWASTYRKLKRDLGRMLDQILNEGTEVRMKVGIEFHEQFGMKFNVQEIDTAFTIGKLVLKRMEIIQTLKRANLLDRNKELMLPAVLQNIAVISSETAAGLQDYRQQLNQNPYRYAYNNVLFAAAMQGQNAVPEILFQLEMIAKRKKEFDAVVIIRGGGAKIDLHAFDHETLAKSVARFPLPVLTGIGHDIDESILDMVAHLALKTPTAVADYLVEHNMYFESGILSLGQVFQSMVQGRFQEDKDQLKEMSQFLKMKSASLLNHEEKLLGYMEQEIPLLARGQLRSAERECAHFETMVELLKPESVLGRGFSLTLKGDEIVKDASDLKDGDLLEHRLKKGSVKSEVKL